MQTAQNRVRLTMPCSFFIKRGQIKLKIAHVVKIRTQKIQDENTRILLVKTEMSLINLKKTLMEGRKNYMVYICLLADA